MKKRAVLLMLVSLFPIAGLAWNTPGQDFSDGLELGGVVTSTRNPWMWQLGDGTAIPSLNPRKPVLNNGKLAVAVQLPVSNILLGKTVLPALAGREGLAPRISFGRGIDGFSIDWTAPGEGRVTLPATAEGNTVIGSLRFKIKAAGLLRHVSGNNAVYAGLYDDLNNNGLPEQTKIMASDLTVGMLQKMFSGEGPVWLSQNIKIKESRGVSNFGDSSLRQLEGVYCAQVVADSAELQLNGEIPSHWKVSLPVSVEYQ